ncbi:MAG: HlyD-family type secretion protein [Pseudomonadota bacterium]|jgi:hemolysin D|nr:HlyD family type I secretion periplasmic adaptor subunit [Oxalobacteraceae bacterium]
MRTRIVLATGAAAALAQRYLDVWRRAWATRASHDRESRRHDEAEFLAGSLALQHTPVSPAPRVAIWLLMVFSLIALLWACFGKLDIVASAPGKVIVSGNTKAIQALGTASVRDIRVREGDAVKAGQLLLVLDPTEPAADVERIANDLHMARAQALQARRVLDAIDRGRLVPQEAPANFSAVRSHELALKAEAAYQEFRSRLARIQAELEKRQAELQSTATHIEKLESTLPYTQARAKDYRQLNERNFMSRHAWMEKEQLRLEQEGELATQRSRASEIHAAVRESLAQRQALITETRRQLLDDWSEGRQKAATLEQELVKAQSRLQLTRLTAPIDGTVQQLAVHTIGGVVTPAQILMLVVPQQQRVEIEALLENKDVGFVHPEQPVEIKLETFPFTRYGTTQGTVTHISRDAITDEKRGLLYLAKIRLAKNTVNVDDHEEPIVPGMSATAEIKTGKRSVIEYFLSPVLQYKSESLRER